MCRKTFTAVEAYTLVRFFRALEHQIDQAFREGDDKRACALARLSGTLDQRVFGVGGEETPFSPPREVLEPSAY
jgi:hypothetical protein